jgi:hypothetical protein
MTETQGKTTNPMDNQQENKEKILRVMTGALSVLSYPPLCCERHCLNYKFLGQRVSADKRPLYTQSMYLKISLRLVIVFRREVLSFLFLVL